MVNNLRLLREHFRLSQEAMAGRMGTTRSQYVKLERGERRLTDKWIERASQAVGVPAAAVIEPLTDLSLGRPPWGGVVQDPIVEINVRAGTGGGGIIYAEDESGSIYEAEGVKDTWGIPAEFVRHSLNTKSDSLQIIEILGDSMFPTLQSGDKVFVDISHQTPSPPGIYAVWDGNGVVVKRVEIIPLSDPMRIKLISDNPHHSAYEVPLDDTRILGRVCARLNVL